MHRLRVKNTGRGRPKQAATKHDKGTDELQRKKLAGLTDTLLDLMHKQALLTDLEYKALVHFRWLHTIRYGIPQYASVKMDYDDYTMVSMHDTDWYEKREREYTFKANQLSKYKMRRVIIDLVLHNQVPSFLCYRFQGNRLILLLDKESVGAIRFKNALKLII